MLFALCAAIATAQKPGDPGYAPSGTSGAEDSVRKAALDYAEGYYSGDAARMARAVHFDLNKAFPRYQSKTDQVLLTYTTYSALIELTASKAGLLPDTARHIRSDVILITPEAALEKVKSAKFNDYLQLVKINGEWKIINVLWNSPQNAAWLRDIPSGEDKGDIENAVLSYIRGIQNGDAEKLRQYVSPDFSRVSLFTAGKDGKTAIQRLRFNALVENAIAGAGRQEEAQKDNAIEVLDVMDGIAMAKILTVSTVEYLQLYRDTDRWKVFNSLQTLRTDKHLDDYLPAIAGEAMPPFTLPVYGGGEFALSDHKAKNILLVFPRGWVGNGWCLFCPYQYLDLAELEKRDQLQKKFNLEIVFVMPYGNERIADWFAKFPETVKKLDEIKQASAGKDPAEDFGAWAQVHFPKTFSFAGGVPDKAFPVLCDEHRTLSKRLKLFTEFWDNRQAEQNMSAIYLIDKTGVLRWKYVSQMTEDRPSTEYLLKVIKEIL